MSHQSASFNLLRPARAANRTGGSSRGDAVTRLQAFPSFPYSRERTRVIAIWVPHGDGLVRQFPQPGTAPLPVEPQIGGADDQGVREAPGGPPPGSVPRGPGGGGSGGDPWGPADGGRDGIFILSVIAYILARMYLDALAAAPDGGITMPGTIAVEADLGAWPRPRPSTARSSCIDAAALEPVASPSFLPECLIRPDVTEPCCMDMQLRDSTTTAAVAAAGAAVTTLDASQAPVPCIANALEGLTAHALYLSDESAPSSPDSQYRVTPRDMVGQVVETAGGTDSPSTLSRCSCCSASTAPRGRDGTHRLAAPVDRVEVVDTSSPSCLSTSTTEADNAGGLALLADAAAASSVSPGQPSHRSPMPSPVALVNGMHGDRLLHLANAAARAVSASEHLYTAATGLDACYEQFFGRLREAAAHVGPVGHDETRKELEEKATEAAVVDACTDPLVELADAAAKAKYASDHFCSAASALDSCFDRLGKVAQVTSAGASTPVVPALLTPQQEHKHTNGVSDGSFAAIPMTAVAPDFSCRKGDSLWSDPEQVQKLLDESVEVATAAVRFCTAVLPDSSHSFGQLAEAATVSAADARQSCAASLAAESSYELLGQLVDAAVDEADRARQSCAGAFAAEASYELLGQLADLSAQAADASGHWCTGTLTAEASYGLLGQLADAAADAGSAAAQACAGSRAAQVSFDLLGQLADAASDAATAATHHCAGMLAEALSHDQLGQLAETAIQTAEVARHWCSASVAAESSLDQLAQLAEATAEASAHARHACTAALTLELSYDRLGQLTEATVSAAAAARQACAAAMAVESSYDLLGQLSNAAADLALTAAHTSVAVDALDSGYQLLRQQLAAALAGAAVDVRAGDPGAGDPAVGVSCDQPGQSSDAMSDDVGDSERSCREDVVSQPASNPFGQAHAAAAVAAGGAALDAAPPPDLACITPAHSHHHQHHQECTQDPGLPRVAAQPPSHQHTEDATADLASTSSAASSPEFACTISLVPGGAWAGATCFAIIKDPEGQYPSRSPSPKTSAMCISSPQQEQSVTPVPSLGPACAGEEAGAASSSSPATGTPRRGRLSSRIPMPPTSGAPDVGSTAEDEPPKALAVGSPGQSEQHPVAAGTPRGSRLIKMGVDKASQMPSPASPTAEAVPAKAASATTTSSATSKKPATGAPAAARKTLTAARAASGPTLARPTTAAPTTTAATTRQGVGGPGAGASKTAPAAAAAAPTQAGRKPLASSAASAAPAARPVAPQPSTLPARQAAAKVPAVKQQQQPAAPSTAGTAAARRERTVAASLPAPGRRAAPAQPAGAQAPAPAAAVLPQPRLVSRRVSSAATKPPPPQPSGADASLRPALRRSQVQTKPTQQQQPGAARLRQPAHPLSSGSSNAVPAPAAAAEKPLVVPQQSGLKSGGRPAALPGSVPEGLSLRDSRVSLQSPASLSPPPLPLPSSPSLTAPLPSDVGLPVPPLQPSASPICGIMGASVTAGQDKAGMRTVEADGDTTAAQRSYPPAVILFHQRQRGPGAGSADVIMQPGPPLAPPPEPQALSADTLNREETEAAAKAISSGDAGGGGGNSAAVAGAGAPEMAVLEAPGAEASPTPRLGLRQRRRRHSAGACTPLASLTSEFGGSVLLGDLLAGTGVSRDGPMPMWLPMLPTQQKAAGNELEPLSSYPGDTAAPAPAPAASNDDRDLSLRALTLASPRSRFSCLSPSTRPLSFLVWNRSATTGGAAQPHEPLPGWASTGNASYFGDSPQVPTPLTPRGVRGDGVWTRRPSLPLLSELQAPDSPPPFVSPPSPSARNEADLGSSPFAHAHTRWMSEAVEGAPVQPPATHSLHALTSQISRGDAVTQADDRTTTHAGSGAAVGQAMMSSASLAPQPPLGDVRSGAGLLRNSGEKITPRLTLPAGSLVRVDSQAATSRAATRYSRGSPATSRSSSPSVTGDGAGPVTSTRDGKASVRARCTQDEHEDEERSGAGPGAAGADRVPAMEEATEGVDAEEEEEDHGADADLDDPADQLMFGHSSLFGEGMAAVLPAAVAPLWGTSGSGRGGGAAGAVTAAPTSSPDSTRADVPASPSPRSTFETPSEAGTAADGTSPASSSPLRPSLHKSPSLAGTSPDVRAARRFWASLNTSTSMTVATTATATTMAPTSTTAARGRQSLAVIRSRPPSESGADLPTTAAAAAGPRSLDGTPMRPRDRRTTIAVGAQFRSGAPGAGTGPSRAPPELPYSSRFGGQQQTSGASDRTAESAFRAVDRAAGSAGASRFRGTSFAVSLSSSWGGSPRHEARGARASFAGVASSALTRSWNLGPGSGSVGASLSASGAAPTAAAASGTAGPASRGRASMFGPWSKVFDTPAGLLYERFSDRHTLAAGGMGGSATQGSVQKEGADIAAAATTAAAAAGLSAASGVEWRDCGSYGHGGGAQQQQHAGGDNKRSVTGGGREGVAFGRAVRSSAADPVRRSTKFAHLARSSLFINPLPATDGRGDDETE